jgi:hypothetical protein
VTLTCAAARELAPDLALGALSGEDRAALLDHLLTCPTCEALARDLAGVVDSLLLLTPEADPPPGFESAVQRRIASLDGPVVIGRSRRGRWLLATAAAIVLIAGGSIVTRATTGGHGRPTALQQQYVSALATVGGRELRAAPLVGPSGASWGQAFVYEGATSWVFISMKWDVPSGTYKVVLDRTAGQPSMSLSGLRLNAGEGSLGHTVGDTRDVNRIRVVDADGRTICAASLPTDAS